jgi:hypothetical protein
MHMAYYLELPALTISQPPLAGLVAECREDARQAAEYVSEPSRQAARDGEANAGPGPGSWDELDGAPQLADRGWLIP